ncbi:hypothetical protein COT75_05115 [Candidatus Beckwithbacteria bacterium CG10_big_fil_rev_8_21_14_0_10_34_10]|uniref:Phosphoribosyltransferase domain-containing protein n=1 Tax=Candidatus Beckwithbacteria bacterium CG10_big_fil_rev_8_21_14_0_10_34_10 TaxID=1974495 RepID=A0A2H0WA90_9BACT|nr:MAG: hypothetical protein COT75_05115 [Candidatus Beckwithbacteria bacterium CG10_big_fil_rev_8_21_14_0_10_34_10]
MKEDQFYFISWKDLEEICFKLYKKLYQEKLFFDRIVCISRGGLVIARIFSDFLDLPISNFTIVSYVSLGKTGKPRIAEKLGVKIKNERILLIDEIVDHGTTLKKAYSYLKKFSPKKITSLVPIIKPWTKLKPDFWVKETNKWIIFPYEIKETIKELGEIWKKEDLSEKEMKNKLSKIGFKKAQLEYFLKENK